MNLKLGILSMFLPLMSVLYANSEGGGSGAGRMSSSLPSGSIDSLVWSLENPLIYSNKEEIKKYSEAIQRRIQSFESQKNYEEFSEVYKNQFFVSLKKLMMNDTFRILPKVKKLNTNELPNADVMSPLWSILKPLEWNKFFADEMLNSCGVTIAVDKNKSVLGFSQISNMFLSYIDYLEKFNPQALAELHESHILKWSIKSCHEKVLSSNEDSRDNDLKNMTKIHMATASFLGDVSMSDKSYHYFLKEMITAYPQAFNHIMQRAAKSPAAQVNLTSFQPFNPNIGKWNNFSSEGKLVQGGNSPAHKGLEPIGDDKAEEK